MEFIKFMALEILMVLGLGATAAVLLYVRKLRQEKCRDAGLRRFQQHLIEIHLENITT